MALTNNLRKQVDLPVWEQLRFAPAVSSALSAACSPDNSNYNEEFGRYIYYLIAANQFFKYDTWADSYIQLSSPPIAPLTWSSMKFGGAYGLEGQVLAASSSSITIPAYSSKVLKGFEVRIIAGTGRGQQRLITDVAAPVEADSGVVTGITATSITDSTKAWAINQWAGYQIRIKYGSGVSQVRRVLYNDATTITFADVNRYSVDYQANPAPFSPALSSTAGSQSVYSIESYVVTVDSNWAVTPDETSKFRVFSGAVILVSSAAAIPFYTIQMYDVASGTWYIRTATSGILGAAATDCAIERTSENGSVWAKGVATAGTTTSLTDSTKQWTVNEHAGRWVRIVSGTGEGQIRQIASNTANVLTWVSVGTAPTTTSRYVVDGFDAGTASSGTASSITDATKSWATNRWKNYAVRIVSGTGAGQILPILSNNGTTLTTYKPFDTTPDNTSVFIIHGDKDNAYILAGGLSAVIVNSLENGVAVLGRSFDEGLVRLASAQYGDMPPVPITSVAGAGTTKTVTTAIPHGFKTGFTISHKGDTGASALTNNISAVITVTGLTTYTYSAPSSSAAWTIGSLSTTVLKDASKNWTVNEHANRIVYFTTAAPVIGTGSSTMVAMEILSNTADTLTLKTASTISVNGISRYVIAERSAIGAVENGIATGSQSTTTLQDTSKAWTVNQWAGRRVRFLSGTGQGVETAITSNTSNTLTFAAVTAPVAGSTSYVIYGGGAKGTGIDASWVFGVSNNDEKGKFLICPRGGAVSGIDKLDLTTDTWDLTTWSPQPETLTTGSMYAYDGGDRLYFTKEVTLRNYYIDLSTNRIHGAGISPYVAGTAILGNRMEIFQTADGLKYLWFNRHSFTECYRQLLIF